MRMLHRLPIAPLAALCLVLTLSAAGAAPAPMTWDHLVRVKSKAFDQAYLLPGADFRAYTKVMIDPARVAFRKDWLKEINASTISLSDRVSQADAERLAQGLRTGSDRIFADEFREAGYTIVTEPGPDVLRISPQVIDLYVAAPDTMSAGRTRSYAVDAGEATIVVEVHDSTTGAALGRGVDRDRAGANSGRRLTRITSVSTQADFEALFRRWARASAKALNTLKELSPLSLEANPTAIQSLPKP